MEALILPKFFCWPAISARKLERSGPERVAKFHGDFTPHGNDLIHFGK
jgi:hypothetical protein